MRAPKAGAFSHMSPVAFRYLHCWKASGSYIGSHVFSRFNASASERCQCTIWNHRGSSQSDIGLIAHVKENGALGSIFLCAPVLITHIVSLLELCPVLWRLCLYIQNLKIQFATCRGLPADRAQNGVCTCRIDQEVSGNM